MSIRRNKQHLTESLARFKVAGSIPEEWEWREATGRDYGIDMYVEPFEEGDTVGCVLFVQIKGRRVRARDMVEEGVTYETSALTYAERFVSPIVVVHCPVFDERPSCRFLWLQEYIRTRLSVDTPDWRDRKRNRLHFPVSNRVQGGAARHQEGDQRLLYIARYPARLESWGKLTMIQNEVRRRTRTILGLQELPMGEIATIRNLLIQARDLPGLSSDPANWQAELSREQAIEPAIRACDLLQTGVAFNRADIEELGWEYTGQAAPQDDREALLVRLERAGEQLSSYLTNVMDPDASRVIWAQFHRGDF